MKFWPEKCCVSDDEVLDNTIVSLLLLYIPIGYGRYPG
jgi:hypothetical protein